MHTAATILKDNWQWRKQIGHLAVYELVKKNRGAALSWLWLFAKPLVFLFVLWFALEIGLRAGSSVGDAPYFLWLACGVIPWFFMSDMLSAGSNILNKYTHLVNKLKFPVSGISTMHCISDLIVHLGLVVILFAIYFFCGMPLDWYLLQVPIIIFVMFLFFNTFSILTSQISAISKDFANLIKTLIRPIFWLSGIIFNVGAINIPWIQGILMFNPVTFFVTSFRDALYYKIWIWEDPLSLGAFALVFLVTFITMLIVYRRLYKVVPDAV